MNTNFKTLITENLDKLPLEFKINQNYPNPFNPSTLIKYSIPQRCHVTIRVFNSLGKEVATLENQTKEAGYYQVKFDGSKFSSGVYYYQITAGSFKRSNKMLLIK